MTDRQIQGVANQRLTDSRSAVAPSDHNQPSGPDTVVQCSKCRTEVEPSQRGQCPACGCWLPGNVGALVHGGRRLLAGHGTPLDVEHRRELRDAVIADKGGFENVSAVLASLIDDFAAAVILRDTAYGHLETVGPLTRAGRKRAVVDLYLAASARADRLANQIGLDRVQRRVPSLAEAMKSE